jgi:hypothetical protein
VLRESDTIRTRRHREEAEGRRGDPGPPARSFIPWIATPLSGLAMTSVLRFRRLSLRGKEPLRRFAHNLRREPDFSLFLCP